MSQIGVPQDNILEPMAGGYPATTPVAAGTSALTLGQNLVDDANQQTGGLPVSDLTPIPASSRVSVYQPDLPKANTQHKDVADPLTSFAAGTTGGPYDANESARARATANGINPALIETSTVLGQPKTTGEGAAYGAFSGGTPGGAVTATKVLQDLTFTAKIPGIQGNGVRIVYADTGTAGAEAVEVLGATITVEMESTVSTAAQIRTALLASEAAMSLLASVVISGTGSNAQTAVAATPLLGGANTPADGQGALTNSKGSFTAINRTGSRNHASVNVIHRPGDNQAAFLF